MRLIDADALKESIKKQLAVAKMVGELFGDDDDDKELMDLICNFFETAAMQEIDNAPTIEQERKTGKWISKPHVYGAVYCSECDYELRMNNTNYCPNCGAKTEAEG